MKGDIKIDSPMKARKLDNLLMTEFEKFMIEKEKEWGRSPWLL